MSRSGGNRIVVLLLISILTTAGITVGGFGIGIGIARMIYGPIDEPLQAPAQSTVQSPEIQSGNNAATALSGSLGPNLHEENGVIVWQSDYLKTHGGVPNVIDGVLVSGSGTPEPDQPAINLFPESSSETNPQANGSQSSKDGQTPNLNWIEGKFLASKTGGKYHRTYCERGMTGAVNIKEENKIWFGSEEEAKTAGYERCGNCW